LSFELDTSIEHGVRLTRLIDSVNKPAKSDGDEAPRSGNPPEASPDDGHVIDEG
jgi:hypothetical protein